MKRIIAVVYFVLLFWIGSEQNVCGQVHAEGKDIYILYDDSSSMIWREDNDDDEDNNYIERWADADYAVRALFACRDDDDRIYVSAMNKVGEVGVKEVKEMKDIEFISDTFFAHTPLSSISRLEEVVDKGNNREKWILILTDGRFQKDEGDGKDNADNGLKSKLKEMADQGIHVVYIPIGDDSVRMSDLEELGVLQVTGSDDVLQQILDSNTSIYQRKTLAVSEKNGSAVIDIDVPLKELIIFIQAEGKLEEDRLEGFKTEFLSHFEGMQADEVTYITRDPDKKVTYVRDEEVREDIKDDKIKMKVISGQMLRFTGTSGYIDDEHTFCYEFLKQNNESIILYYQLDLGLEIEVCQEGKVLEPGQAVKEGTYGVKVYPINPVSKARVSKESWFLNDIELFLNGNGCSWGNDVIRKAKWGENITLEAKAEGDGISDASSEQRKLEVIKKIYPLSITFTEVPESIDYDAMNQGSIENGETDGWQIEVREDIEDDMKEDYPDGIRDITLNYLEVECDVRCPGEKSGEDSPIKTEIRNGRGGEYYIYPYLASEDDYNIYESAVLIVKAYRKDAEEESVTIKEQKISLKAEARNDFIAEIMEGEEYSWWDMVSGNAKISLKCAGKELSEEEYGKVTYNALEGDQGRNAFERWGQPLDWRYWFFYDKQEVQINKEVVYMRRGIPCKCTVTGTIAYRPVPLFIRVIGHVAEGFILCTFLWIAALRISRRNFGIGYKAYLYLQEKETGIMQEEVIHPSGKLRNLLWPRPLTIVLSDSYGRNKENFPDMHIRKEGKELRIVNAEAFRDLNYTVSGKNVSRVQSISFDQIIEIEETSSLHYQLHFKKRGDRSV